MTVIRFLSCLQGEEINLSIDPLPRTGDDESWTGLLSDGNKKRGRTQVGVEE
ncbi:unnamed protein product [Dovyalis caffra]|uniref:Uncharacterized protein n=1 Tax=Dovyalis caffra TaxID=77055 RepID=A0AAV1SP09_9ROSI|nr:unnamed protein product [Dovyalis caffra]